MSTPAFIQQQPRSLGLPIVLALVVLIGAGAWFSLSQREGNVEGTATHTAVLEMSSEYKSDSMVMAPPHTELTLFIAPELAFVNHRKIPVTVNDFQLTLKDASGAQLTENPLSPAEIASAEQSFPQLKPALTATMLRRETEVAPGGTLKGMLVFSAPVGKAQWDSFKTAELNVDIYNQPPLLIELK